MLLLSGRTGVRPLRDHSKIERPENLKKVILIMKEKKISTRSTVREIITNHNLQTKKKLGQHFLVDERVVEKIINASNIDENTVILEVGPGIGVLTQRLVEEANHVIAIELDKQLIPVLEENFINSPLTIVQGDILKVDLQEILKPFQNMDIKVVANLPYYITTPIILYMLESDIKFKSITVMVQKEVAQRMAANSGKKEYGSLSLAVQYHADVEIVAYVPVNCFMPRPGVDSAVVHLKILENKRVDGNKEELFKVIHAAFNKRRKTLVNALDSADIGNGKENIANILESIGLDPQIRGEKLNIFQFSQLAEALNLQSEEELK